MQFTTIDVNRLTHIWDIHSTNFKQFLLLFRAKKKMNARRVCCVGFGDARSDGTGGDRENRRDSEVAEAGVENMMDETHVF